MTLQRVLTCRAFRNPNFQKPLWSGAAWQLMRGKMEKQVRPYSQQNTRVSRLFQANHKSVQKLSSHGMKKKFIMSGWVPAEDKLPAEAHLPLPPRAQDSSLLSGASGWSTKLALVLKAHCLQFKLAWRAYIACVFKRPGMCSRVIQEGNEENKNNHTLLQLSGLRQADECSSRLYPVYLPGEKE